MQDNHTFVFTTINARICHNLLDAINVEKLSIFVKDLANLSGGIHELMV